MDAGAAVGDGTGVDASDDGDGDTGDDGDTDMTACSVVAVQSLTRNGGLEFSGSI